MIKLFTVLLTLLIALSFGGMTFAKSLTDGDKDDKGDKGDDQKMDDKKDDDKDGEKGDK